MKECKSRVEIKRKIRIENIIKKKAQRKMRMKVMMKRGKGNKSQRMSQRTKGKKRLKKKRGYKFQLGGKRSLK